ncbi:Uclacyanin 1 like [Actinidia chinensis var. chinensis]|uniref:Uclacyanin 1 like n=1 Tax=Actinidia chinensis var. chinensis TaxID=1590841 RepID=A0A2R6PXH8_ACTCC|nr:Uclacyanin 1 like [Actinidia chinensis var. chinensis]
MGGVKLLVAVVVVVVGLAGRWAGAQVHHVVGADRGWDPSSDLASWSSARIFTVGDKIWFTYSAAQDKIVEVKSKEEYEACDVSNPIRMYTNGLDSVSLEEERIRYFASGKPENCKNGLKLHVDVQPLAQANHDQHRTVVGSALAVADGPTSPASAHAYGLSYVFFIGLLICYLGL